MQKKARAKGIPWPAPSFFRARPLMCGALCFIFGISVCQSIPYRLWMWAVPAALFALAFAASKVRRAAAALLFAGLFSLGALLGAMAWTPPPLPKTGRWRVEGTVLGPVRRSDKAVQFTLTDVRVQRQGEEAWTRIDSSAYCYFPGQAAWLSHGQRVEAQGSSYLPQGARNPGGFDQRMWLSQQGTHVRLYLGAAPRQLAPAGLSVRGAALSISEALGQRMDALFGGASSVVRAMLLGDRVHMPEDWSDWMRDSGVAHLLSVSGLHVALWYALLSALLSPLPVSPRVRWLLLAALLGAYALVTGLSDSVLRAVVMLLALEGASVWRKKADPLTTVSLSALCILLFRPLDLFAPGFQLSFTAVLGLSLLRPPLRRLLPAGPKLLRDGLTATVAAQAGILPAMARWFGTVSWVSVPANVLAVPIAGLLVPTAALATALDALWPPLSWLPALACRGMVAVMLFISRAAAAAPLLRVPAFSWWAIAAYGVCALLCSTAVVWKWKTRCAAMALAVCAAVSVGYIGGFSGPRYVQLDVGQALSGVLHAGGKTYVYDCGEENSDLTEYLTYCGASVDGLFLSHPHADHTGGLTELLDAGIRVGTVYVPANATAFGAESGYAKRLEGALAQGARVVEVAAGDTLSLGGVKATVIAPEREVTRGSDPNDRSIVLLVAAGEKTLLLLGDADGPAEPLGVDCDVLQVAHHGSASAARPAFLRDATPDIALISAGKNSYGHPDGETLARLRDAGAEVYLTQDSGALTVYFGKDDIRVEVYCP